VAAYLVAEAFPMTSPRPTLAPLTALLVLQISLYRTVRTAVQRIASVVSGLLIAVLLAKVVGFTWWSLAWPSLPCRAPGPGARALVAPASVTTGSPAGTPASRHRTAPEVPAAETHPKMTGERRIDANCRGIGVRQVK
jgi:hypothetical protein